MIDEKKDWAVIEESLGECQHGYDAKAYHLLVRGIGVRRDIEVSIPNELRYCGDFGNDSHHVLDGEVG